VVKIDVRSTVIRSAAGIRRLKELAAILFSVLLSRKIPLKSPEKKNSH